MVRTTTCLVAAAVAVPALVLVAQQRFPSAPRPQDGTAVYVSTTDWNARLKKDVAARPNLSTTEISTTTDYIISVAHRGQPAGAIVHSDAHEMFYIVDGSGTLVTGGTIVRGAGGANTATIEGGETRHVQKGDVIVIPKNTPHWYREIDGTLVYLEGRFKAPSD
jgi:mannose-6-phosphate isomerase-like protein (cupin superfamily)